MTGLAKGLPIGLVIEQGRVTTMRNNMIHNSGSSQASMLLTFQTKRMDGQKGSTSINPRPLRVQAVVGYRFGPFVAVWLPVSTAGVCTRLRITRAARRPTGTVGFVHVTPPQARKKTYCGVQYVFIRRISGLILNSHISSHYKPTNAFYFYLAPFFVFFDNRNFGTGFELSDLPAAAVSLQANVHGCTAAGFAIIAKFAYTKRFLRYTMEFKAIG